MALPIRTSVLLAAAAWSFIASADGVNPDANAFFVQFNETSIGPDGPWWFVSQAIDYPDQFVNMLPGLTQTDLIISDGACSSSSSDCPLPIPPLWYQSGAWLVSNGRQTEGPFMDPGPWDIWTTTLLDLKGSGRYIQDRLTLHENGVSTAADFLDWHGMMASSSFAATFPGGAKYTLDTGFLSLYAAYDDILWTAASNSSTVSFNRTLPNAYYAGYIPSISYGLHVGSVTNNIAASLVVGGYDSSRCLTEPIVSDSVFVQLTQINLGVASGGSAFSNPETIGTNMLRANGSAIDALEVWTKPEVPYLYLPQDTCDQIAKHLPVTYNKDFNLYFWNTDDVAYTQILSSPHYIAFTFLSGTTTSTIHLPFALLNLTLDSPLVGTPTRYFPCSPWTPANAPYHLGRAFLQGAFLSQNWQTGKLFLAQAPGPDLSRLTPYIKNIASGDTSISPATNPPSWTDTWASTLQALPHDVSAETSATGGSEPAAGTIAGIVIGVVAVIAIIAAAVWFLVRRKRRARKAVPTSAPPYDYSSYSDIGHKSASTYAYRSEPMVSRNEASTSVYPVEMDATRLGELSGDEHR